MERRSIASGVGAESGGWTWGFHLCWRTSPQRLCWFEASSLLLFFKCNSLSHVPGTLTAHCTSSIYSSLGCKQRRERERKALSSGSEIYARELVEHGKSSRLVLYNNVLLTEESVVGLHMAIKGNLLCPKWALWWAGKETKELGMFRLGKTRKQSGGGDVEETWPAPLTWCHGRRCPSFFTVGDSTQPRGTQSLDQISDLLC